MNRTTATRLYDALHQFESRYRRSRPYPVHKRLNFDDASITNIYDWILSVVQLPERGKILDAGCGTGFGTIRLAESGNCFVSGISLSSSEISSAERSRLKSSARDRLSFNVQSFDELPSNKYDLIVAVESVKHSTDLARTLQTLRASLTATGRIVIVEDCFLGKDTDATAKRLCNAWGLTRLYTAADYKTNGGGAAVVTEDLSHYMVGRTASAKLRAKLLKLGLRTFGSFMNPVARDAMLGGLDLQELYAREKMRYLAFIL